MMTINLTHAAVILWSGMLVIAGAILILSSQVRHLVELIESRPSPTPPPTSSTAARTPVRRPSSGRARNAGVRGDSAPARGVARRPARDLAYRLDG